MKKKQHIGPLLQIGIPKDLAAGRVHALVMDVLNCEKSGDTAKVEAFKTIATLCNVSGTTIQNCNFKG